MSEESEYGRQIRLSSAELLVKGELSWRELTATLPYGPSGGSSGVNVYNKVYFFGKSLINLSIYQISSKSLIFILRGTIALYVPLLMLINYLLSLLVQPLTHPW